ncbi:hypothetical protein [Celeribacter marinus]|uniref:Uncharacterized protein n=1 Tax=Celeribacter marinus TaxID=1397108 RepID=A0A0N9ZPB7_9RHOB|nr:hypothetical protein [Celeribacter marinus]ALI55370.1 hypothetical protein IMCC12053_1423 [Celeribacter marinus]SFL06814.1 hypothetical protein SAMN05444421_11526 [Celeribacter marinus]
MYFIGRPDPDAFSVSFTDRQFNADEVWFVTGACSKMTDPAPIYVTPLELDAELKVFLTRYRFAAKRTVCIVNQQDAPPAFWSAYDATRKDR